jgi:N-acetylneuraminate lyase
MCEAKGNLYAVMKEILKRREGLQLGGVRAPLANLFPEDESVVTTAQAMIEEAIKAL